MAVPWGQAGGGGGGGGEQQQGEGSVHCVAPFACEQGEVRSEFSRFYFGIGISVTDGGIFLYRFF
eukprot:COSAG01_NODE_9253_length_2502_cov_3.151061_3_plen_65_part_00